MELASSAKRTFKVFSEGHLIRDKTACRVDGSGGQDQASGTDTEVKDRKRLGCLLSLTAGGALSKQPYRHVGLFNYDGPVRWNLRDCRDRVAQMETFRPRLLEVKVTSVPPLWRWQVLAGDNELATGFESAQVAASFAAYDTLFKLLAEGWSPSPSKSP